MTTTITQHEDFIGKPIKLGDLVVFNGTRRHKRLHIGRVIKATPKRISMTYFYNPSRHGVCTTHICHPSMVMKIERSDLPSNIPVPE